MREIYEDQQRKDMQEMAKFLEELKAGTNEELIFRLNERIAQLKGEIEEVSDKGIVEDGGIEAYSDNVRFETSRLAVRRPADKDKTAFLKVKEEYSYFKRTFSHEELKDALWKEHLSEQSLYCSILLKNNSDYVGYCGIKNLHKGVWEIAIELKAEYCGKGYGYETMSAFFAFVTGVLGAHVYSSRVETENLASQRLMEKLGFQPYGISEFLLRTEDEKREAEEKYAFKIDDRYRELARRFHTSPEKLISHVLEYRKAVDG